MTSSTVDLSPVARIDSEPVGNAWSGQLTRSLRGGYLAHAAAV